MNKIIVSIIKSDLEEHTARAFRHSLELHKDLADTCYGRSRNLKELLTTMQEVNHDNRTTNP